ncbi:MAG: hypothetical protein JWN95_4157 [Frankiales bacterium]|nr:hypothetical protein [Frankiales bacterium]
MSANLVNTTLVERYLACWNETDADTRRALIEQTWSAAAEYRDPMAQVHGVEEIDATIAAVQGQFPGLVFTPVGEVDAHHQQARFQWGLGPDGAEPLIVGFDVAVLDEDGRITTVLGFLDKVPG